jgi:hypothetical protein
MIKLLNDGVNSVVILALFILVEHSGELHPFRVDSELRRFLEGLANGNAPTVKDLARVFLE